MGSCPAQMARSIREKPFGHSIASTISRQTRCSLSSRVAQSEIIKMGHPHHEQDRRLISPFAARSLYCSALVTTSIDDTPHLDTIPLTLDLTSIRCLTAL